MEAHKGLTIDMIIAKFIPILGGILFTTGLGYLIYTSVWEAMVPTVRLGVGFFTSLVIIGGAFSFSDRLRYFADVVMGSGILLLYGTLIYGSRASESVQAIIPEVATLLTAFVFTLAVAFFASLRKSKVILMLGIIGAYLTPFVIGQNDVWASNISFNAYLIYFAAVNLVIFLLGKEIAVHDLIPLNLAGLFFGTYTLYSLIYSGNISYSGSGFFSSPDFTLALLALLLIVSVLAIAYSSNYFSTKGELWISLGYLLPFIWYLFQKDLLVGLSQGIEIAFYLVISISYFVAWYYLRPKDYSHYQHIAAYVGGITALLFAIGKFFGDWHLYASLLLSFIGLIFALIYLFEGNKGERILTAIAFTGIGGFFTLMEIYGSSSNIRVVYPTLTAIIGLVPAILLAPIVYLHGKTPKDTVTFTNIFSLAALVIAAIILLLKIINTLDFEFSFFVLPGFLAIIYAYVQKSYAYRGNLMRLGAIWLSFGFLSTFLYFISNFIPHVADKEHFWIGGGIFENWYFIKGIFAIIGFFLALSVSREIQKKEKVDRPSFLLVIFAYTSLLLVVNFMIITFCNDIGVEFTTGGPRAIGTTLWWIVLAIFMIMSGVQLGHGHRSEKLLGLLLLFLTVGKIGIYDMGSMSMDKKIIVLMVVGGILMLFSYFLQVKGYLKEGEE